MPISFIGTALFTVSVLTNATVEGLKKILDSTQKKYSSNVLAAITAAILACALCTVYIVLNDVTVTAKIIVQVLALMYLGFLVATVGYDKVVQMLKQLHTI